MFCYQHTVSAGFQLLLFLLLNKFPLVWLFVLCFYLHRQCFALLFSKTRVRHVWALLSVPQSACREGPPSLLKERALGEKQEVPGKWASGSFVPKMEAILALPTLEQSQLQPSPERALTSEALSGSISTLITIFSSSRPPTVPALQASRAVVRTLLHISHLGNFSAQAACPRIQSQSPWEEARHR